MSHPREPAGLFHPVPAVRTLPGARETIRGLNQSGGIKLVVLDDDPTGCQTVHDVKILTTWDRETVAETAAHHDIFFILTNTRAYGAEKAAALTRQIATVLTGCIPAHALRIISRSDSTLRGHFGAEVMTLVQACGPYDGILIIPFFGEGGRYTIDGTHYLEQQDALVEVHRTEFARDPVFGYAHSYLPAWVAEQSKGFWTQEAVVKITLSDIREGGVERVHQILKKVEGTVPVTVDAMRDEDLEVVALALCRAEQEGKRFLYRTAASFVKIRAGIEDKALFEPLPVATKGLIVVGSHVQKTTEQLQCLLQEDNLERVAVQLATIFSDACARYLGELTRQVDRWLSAGQSVVVYTEREYALQGDYESRLKAGEIISDFLSTLVNQLTVAPDFIIAKGGITSLDVARKGLHLTEGVVVGQIEPGVPVWQLGKGSKHPGMLYVVFPGNVGNAQSLKSVYTKLTGK